MWLVGARSMTRGWINQEAGAPPFPGFSHIMLNIKRVKDDMRFDFIKKFFTNCEIRTSVQKIYLCFKGMLYESKNYLCDISCVQLWQVLTWFWCGNT